MQKGKSRDLIAATGLVILHIFIFNEWFLARTTLKYDVWSRKMIFRSHQWIESWSYSPKMSNAGQNLFFFCFFCCVWPWNFDGWPWNTTGHLFYATSSFVHHFAAIGEFNLQLQSGSCSIGFLSLWLWPLTFDLDLCMDITFVNGNNSWKFHDDTNILKKVWQTARSTEERIRGTDWLIHRPAWWQLKTN